MSDDPEPGPRLPSFAESFRARHPEVWDAYSRLGKAVGEAGPLDERTQRLVKLALAIGVRSEGSVHSHTRRALEAGISVDELEQVALLAITTLGFSNAMAALAWINDVVRKQKSR